MLIILLGLDVMLSNLMRGDSEEVVWRKRKKKLGSA
jgi:hypothetical protein